MKQTELELLQEAITALNDMRIAVHKLKVYYGDLYYKLNVTIPPVQVRLFDASSWEQVSYELNTQWNIAAKEGK